ncbi:hypothetical protein NHX12_030918 [Muraenolepis orangiensis]|uniref:Uncharacterized protein n=1 Tax=Muraenolepis orangiensis TaxID=630683 RepID=A0A9Q0IM38_9TELE|nr:hypothetical protein NHX12_030918 [Muraenolepis orangiensis]
MSTLRFGQHLIKASAVFLRTELCFALVNRKPVVPGRRPDVHGFQPANSNSSLDWMDVLSLRELSKPYLSS